MNFSRSSMGLHAFQGILRSPQKARLCNPCLRYELSPFSQEGHDPLPALVVAGSVLSGRLRANDLISGANSPPIPTLVMRGPDPRIHAASPSYGFRVEQVIGSDCSDGLSVLIAF
jgi:hypothetical protein